MHSAPVFRCEFADDFEIVFHQREPFEHIGEVGLWIDAVVLAVLHDGVDNGGTLSCLGVSDEEPVFHTEFTGAHGSLGGVVIDASVRIIDIAAELDPVVEGILNALVAFRARIQSLHIEVESPLDLLQHGQAAFLAHGEAVQAGVLLELALDFVKFSDLEDIPSAGPFVIVAPGLMELAPGMRHAADQQEALFAAGCFVDLIRITLEQAPVVEVT